MIYVINGYNIRGRNIHKDDGTSRCRGMAWAVDGALLKHVDSSLPEMVDIDIIYAYIIYIYIYTEREKCTRTDVQRIACFCHMAHICT